MAVICPAILAEDPKTYNQQMVVAAGFARRLHLDVMDGVLTPTRSPQLSQVTPPKDTKLDIHVMFEQPAAELNALLALKPNMVIVHAEAQGNFVDIARRLHEHGVKAGVALLPQTKPETIQPALEHIDHVLVFSGDLGRFGGMADVAHLRKVAWCRQQKPSLEIGWDGGVNDENIKELAAGGVDVLNVGSYIQRADNPKRRFAKLQSLLD